VWFAILVCGVLASAVAFVVQTWAQRRIPPARVALILVTEPAFGGLFGWWTAGVWPIREVIGAAMMLGGMITSEAVAAMAPQAEGVTFEPAMEGIPAPVLDDGHKPSGLFEEQ
jgi:threonine/homoserine efflux transporter RhtA